MFAQTQKLGGHELNRDSCHSPQLAPPCYRYVDLCLTSFGFHWHRNIHKNLALGGGGWRVGRCESEGPRLLLPVTYLASGRALRPFCLAHYVLLEVMLSFIARWQPNWRHEAHQSNQKVAQQLATISGLRLPSRDTSSGEHIGRSGCLNRD